MTEDKILTTKEAAIFLNVDPRTFRRWKKSGKVTPDIIDGQKEYYYESQLRTLRTTADIDRGQRTIESRTTEDTADITADITSKKYDKTEDKPRTEDTKPRTTADTTEDTKLRTFVSYSNEFLERIKEHTKELAEHFLDHSPDGNLVCPSCGNGSGNDGTGIKFKDEVAHCFVCGSSFNIFQAVMAANHCDFQEAVKTCANIIGIEQDNMASKPRQIKKENKPQFHQVDMSLYYNECHEALKDSKIAIAYLKSRGLYDEKLIDDYEIGYDPINNCIVIPHNRYFCTRRIITSDKKFRYKYLKGEKTALFNAVCLSSEVIFIVEGAIDALSIIKAGGQAVAIGGVSNTKLLMEELKNIATKPAIIILTDDDEAGNKAADKIAKELEVLQIFATKQHLPDKRDPNDMLVSNYEALKQWVNDLTRQTLEELQNWTPATTQELIPAQIEETEIVTEDFINLPNLDLKLICPNGYSINEDGIIKLVWNEKKQEYKEIRVSYAPILITKAIKNIDDRIHKRELSCYDRISKQWTKTTAENAVVFNSRSIVQLASKGLSAASNTAGLLVEYLSKTDYVNARNIPRTETINNIGWRNNEFLPVSNNSKYELDDSIKSKIEAKFKSKGDKGPILAIIKELKENHFDIANMIIGATLAAPMRRKIFDHNIAIHFAGMTGCGKTAINTLAYSLFYNTEIEMPRFNGTRNGFERIFAGLRDLPVFIDDANNLSDKERALAEKLIYDYVNGIPRVRTNKNLEEPILEPFYGTLLTTGEHFLTTNTSAGGAKTREMEFNGGSKYLKDEVSRVIYRVTKGNYGLFLHDWIEIIKDNKTQMKEMYNLFLYNELPDCIQGKIPRHINNIAAIATANIFFDMYFLGMEELKARGKELISSINILEKLPDYAQIADFERAKPIIRDMVISNLKRFVRFDKYHNNGNDSEFELTSETPDTYGIIKKDSVGIIRHIFDKWLFDNGFSELTKTQLADDGFIVRNGRNLESWFYNYPKKGTKMRMYKIPIQYIFEEMQKD